MLDFILDDDDNTQRGTLNADRMVGNGGRDDLRGSNGDDNIWAGDAAGNADWDRDVLYGGTGNDLFFGVDGKDKVVGGEGYDVVVYDLRLSTASFSKQSAGLTDLLVPRIHSIEALAGQFTRFDDFVGAGHAIYGADGGDGVDTYNAIYWYDYVVAASFFIRVASVTTIFEAGTMSVLLTHENDTKRRFEVTNFEKFQFTGTGGDDVLEGGHRADVLNGLKGEDFLRGGGGEDHLFGGRHNDYLDGGQGRDVVYGGRGDDTIIVRDGLDKVDGGKGFDEVRLDFRDWQTGATFNSIERNRDFSEIEKISGTFTDFNDIVTVGAMSGDLYGQAGFDILQLDFRGMDAHVDSDVTVTRATTATYHDITREEEPGVVYVTATLSDGSVQRFAASGFERLIVEGTDNSDFLTHGDIDVTFYGRGGRDILQGSRFSDELFGGKGRDDLFGGAGNDVMSGGIGEDHFYFEASTEGISHDRILDFDPTKDTLVFSGIFSGGTYQFQFDALAQASTVQGNSLRISLEPGGSSIGTGSGDFGQNAAPDATLLLRGIDDVGDLFGAVEFTADRE
ncbi:calcium-binding protein [Algirhabdus cladophorae]|uniref:calcium-binding protein n=1 Tax=Algirhabdus cladophorae TaxID=3377108 RepID=UPI003B849F19